MWFLHSQVDSLVQLAQGSGESILMSWAEVPVANVAEATWLKVFCDTYGPKGRQSNQVTELQLNEQQPVSDNGAPGLWNTLESQQHFHQQSQKYVGDYVGGHLCQARAFSSSLLLSS